MRKLVFILIFYQLIFSGLCLWRNPDRDIKKIFPKATHYKSIIRKYNKKEKEKIEKLIGKNLDIDETEFTFYQIFANKKRIGTVLTHTEKGEYGAIEVVIGLDTLRKVIKVLIQRDREIKSKELRSENFLKQFEERSFKDTIEVNKTIKPIKGAEKASKAIAFSVKKMLIVYEVLKEEK
uniref:FMN-binding protein n=1 Tax=candidate division WOR-3 bacterium TaxID=2052148 RepID=A0A7V3ZVF2_UNCW3